MTVCMSDGLLIFHVVAGTVELAMVGAVLGILIWRMVKTK